MGQVQALYCVADGAPASALQTRPSSVNLTSILLGIALTVSAQLFVRWVSVRAAWLANLQRRLQRISSNSQASTSTAALPSDGPVPLLAAATATTAATAATAAAPPAQQTAGTQTSMEDSADEGIDGQDFRDRFAAAVMVSQRGLSASDTTPQDARGSPSGGPDFSTSSPKAPLESNLGESVEWVNMCFRKVWRVYQRGLERWIVDLLQPVFDGLVADGLIPRPLQRLRIVEFTLDHEAPIFSNMRRRTSRKDSDLCGVVDIRYTGGARMLLMIELGEGRWRLKIPVLVSDLDLEGKMWIKLRLAPLCPWIGQISFAFVGPPAIKAQISPYNRVNLMRIPILQNLVRQLLTVDLPGLMVLPQRLELNIPPALTTVAEAAVGRDTIMRAVASAVLQTDALEAALIAALPLGPQTAAGGVTLPDFFQGELTVGLVEARNLPVWGMPWQSNPYCRITLGDQALQSRRDCDTSVKGRHRAPCWNQEMQFLVEDPETQELEIELRDSHMTGRVEVGHARLPLNNLPRDGHAVEIWLPLESAAQGGKSGGEVLLRLTYRVFEDDHGDSGYREAEAYARALQDSHAITDIKSAAAASSRAAVAASAAASAIAMTKAAAARAAARAARAAKAAAAAASAKLQQRRPPQQTVLEAEDIQAVLVQSQQPESPEGSRTPDAKDEWRLGPEFDGPTYAAEVEAVDRMLGGMYMSSPAGAPTNGYKQLAESSWNGTRLAHALPVDPEVAAEDLSHAAAPLPELPAQLEDTVTQTAAAITEPAAAVLASPQSDTVAGMSTPATGSTVIPADGAVAAPDKLEEAVHAVSDAMPQPSAAVAAEPQPQQQRSWWSWWRHVQPIWPATASPDHAEDVPVTTAGAGKTSEKKEPRGQAAMLAEANAAAALQRAAAAGPSKPWWSFATALWPFKSQPSNTPGETEKVQKSDASTNTDTPVSSQKTAGALKDAPEANTNQPSPQDANSGSWMNFVPRISISFGQPAPKEGEPQDGSPSPSTPALQDQPPVGEIVIPPDLPLEEIAKEVAQMKQEMWNAKVDHVQNLWAATVEKNDRSWLVVLTALAAVAVCMLAVVMYRLEHLPM